MTPYARAAEQPVSIPFYFSLVYPLYPRLTVKDAADPINMGGFLYVDLSGLCVSSLGIVFASLFAARARAAIKNIVKKYEIKVGTVALS